MAPVFVLVVYAILMLSGGMYAFLSAPPEANRATAIIIPSVCAAIMLVFAGLIASGRKTSRGGKPLVWVAGIVALLIGIAIANPARARERKMINWPAASAAWTEATKADPTLAERAAADRAVRKAFFDQRESPDHDQTYLVHTLWTLSISSTLTAIILLAMAFRARRSAIPA
jgi:hypothetical protein